MKTTLLYLTAFCIASEIEITVLNPELTTTETIEDGARVRVHYKGTFSDGEEFDNSYWKKRPVEVIMGSGAAI